MEMQATTLFTISTTGNADMQNRYVTILEKETGIKIEELGTEKIVKGDLMIGDEKVQVTYKSMGLKEKSKTS